MSTRVKGRVEATVGYAAATDGSGVAYASVRGGEEATVLRVPFSVRRLAGCEGREIAFAAVAAVAKMLRARGVRELTLLVPPEAVTDLRVAKPIPQCLAMPYVAMRCALNGLASAAIEPAPRGVGDDLRRRAQAETALHVAA